MEGELWNQVYRVVRRVARAVGCQQTRRGRPDHYSVEIVMLCWLWAAWRNQPLMRAVEELGSRPLRRRLRRCGFRLPALVPHETTLRRRAKRADFSAFCRLVQARLRRTLSPRRVRSIMDSTALPVGRMSNDPEAALGVYRLFGYRWHTIVSQDGVVLASEVQPANVHDARVATSLVQQAGEQGAMRWLVADAAYDSEALHRLVRHELRGHLVAPLNRRGNPRHRFRGTPCRKWLAEHWKSPLLRRVWRLRGSIERFYSRLKSSRFGLWALPPWVRRLANVRRWVELKAILYHVYLVQQRKSSTN
jgi:Transposase DDE domain